MNNVSSGVNARVKPLLKVCHLYAPRRPSGTDVEGKTLSADGDNVGGSGLWVRSKASSNPLYLADSKETGIVSSDL